MTEALYIVCEADGRKYKVTGWNKEAGTITLKGEFGEFDEQFNKELFKRMGYTLVKEIEQEPEPQPVQENEYAEF